MVVNIGDTVSVISEVGLGIGEGKKPEDFLHDPNASSDDSGDESDDESDDESEDDEEWSSDDKACHVCSLGLTVDENNIIPYPEANGASCAQMLQFAAAGVQREVCDQMKMAEAICCPPTAA